MTRTIEVIKGLVADSDWNIAIPKNRAEPCWEQFRIDLGLTFLELSIFKNDRFSIGNHNMLKHTSCYKKPLLISAVLSFLFTNPGGVGKQLLR